MVTVLSPRQKRGIYLRPSRCRRPRLKGRNIPGGTSQLPPLALQPITMILLTAADPVLELPAEEHGDSESEIGYGNGDYNDLAEPGRVERQRHTTQATVVQTGTPEDGDGEDDEYDPTDILEHEEYLQDFSYGGSEDKYEYYSTDPTNAETGKLRPTTEADWLNGERATTEAENEVVEPVYPTERPRQLHGKPVSTEDTNEVHSQYFINEVHSDEPGTLGSTRDEAGDVAEASTPKSESPVEIATEQSQAANSVTEDVTVAFELDADEASTDTVQGTTVRGTPSTTERRSDLQISLQLETTTEPGDAAISSTADQHDKPESEEVQPGSSLKVDTRQVPTRTRLYLFSNFPEFTSDSAGRPATVQGEAPTTETGGGLEDVNSSTAQSASSVDYTGSGQTTSLTSTEATTESHGVSLGSSQSELYETFVAVPAKEPVVNGDEDRTETPMISAWPGRTSSQKPKDQEVTTALSLPVSSPQEQPITRRPIPSLRSRPTFSKFYRFGKGTPNRVTEATTTQRVPTQRAVETTSTQPTTTLLVSTQRAAETTSTQPTTTLLVSTQRAAETTPTQPTTTLLVSTLRAEETTSSQPTTTLLVSTQRAAETTSTQPTTTRFVPTQRGLEHTSTQAATSRSTSAQGTEEEASSTEAIATEVSITEPVGRASVPANSAPTTRATPPVRKRKPSLEAVRSAIQPFSLAEMLVESGQSLAQFLSSDYSMKDVMAVIERLRARREGRPIIRPEVAEGAKRAQTNSGGAAKRQNSAGVAKDRASQRQETADTERESPETGDNVVAIPQSNRSEGSLVAGKTVPPPPPEPMDRPGIARQTTETPADAAPLSSAAESSPAGRRRQWSLAEILVEKQVTLPEFLAQGGNIKQLLLEYNGVEDAEEDVDAATTATPPGTTTKKVFSLAEILGIKNLTLKQFISQGGNVRAVLEEYNGVDWRPPTRAPPPPAAAVTTPHVPAFLTRSTAAPSQPPLAPSSTEAAPPPPPAPLPGNGLGIRLQTAAPPVYGRPAAGPGRLPPPRPRDSYQRPPASAPPSLSPDLLFEQINRETEAVWAAAGGTSGGGGGGGDQHEVDSTVFDIGTRAEETVGGRDALITSGVVGGFALCFFVALLLFCKWRQRREQQALRPGLAVSSDRSSSPLEPGRINVNNYANAYRHKSAGFWGSLRKSFNQRYATAYSESPYGGVTT
ncbi:uncharacterized protein LOC119110089 [Pollicipes pollicipes]|uniref:uncharacterized protein LOC119110089 n=1 Tax=Pollicipes pollicipes TaxID=41117 RepID=UPI0018853FA4|nr:uncharacterized protein LOC119110089 [Pollicipes pollicipes]